MILRVLAFVACALLAPSPAGAQGALDLQDAEVRVNAYSAWPTELDWGYVPVRVVLENYGDTDRTVTTELSQFDRNAENRAARTVLVPGGRTVELELAYPLFGLRYAGFMLRVDAGVERSHTYGVFDVSFRSNRTPGVVLAATKPSPTELEAWAGALKTKDLAARTGTLPNVALGGVAFTDAPVRAAAYSSLRLVVVDGSQSIPPAVGRPLVNWLRTGGVVVVSAPEALEAARRLDGVAPWLEPRFELPPPIASADTTVRGWSVGFGTLVAAPTSRVAVLENLAEGVAEGGTSLDLPEGLREIVEAALDGPAPIAPDARRRFAAPAIPGIDELPLRGYMVLMLLFVILVGPVNFALVRASGKPALLLVTIPVLSLGAAGLILAYGFLHQGVDVKSASYSVSVLDQRQHTAQTLEFRTLFAGLSTRGLAPAAGTVCLPLVTDVKRSSFRVEHGEGLRLEGTYVPARRRSPQAVVVDRAARARIRLARAGQALAAQNGLETDVVWMVAKDPDGVLYHKGGGRARAGEAFELEAVSPGVDAEKLFDSIFELLPGDWDDASIESADRKNHLRSLLPATTPFDTLDALWPASYLAVVDSNPFRDDCGLETNELLGVHFVVGVLATGEEDWR